MAVLASPVVRIVNSGVPAVDAKIYVYESGTTTPVPTYADEALTAPNTHPVITDSNGEARIYVQGDQPLRVVATTALDVPISDDDPWVAVPADIAATLTAFAASLGGIESMHKGPNPPTPGPGKLWLHDSVPSATVWTIRLSDGEDWLAVARVDTVSNAILYLGGPGAATMPAYTFSGDDDTGMYRISANIIGWSTNGAERMRLDASGNLMVGRTALTTANERLSVGGEGIVASNGTVSVLMGNFGTGVGVLGTLSDHDLLLRTNNTTAMRLTSLQKILIGTPTATGSSTLQMHFPGSTHAGFYLNDTTGGSSAHSTIGFHRGGTLVGTITTTNTATAYNTSSDGRLKEDFEALEDVGDIIDALEPVKYRWRHIDDKPHGVGFIAQDVHAVIPEAVSPGDGNMEAMPGDEGFMQWAMDMSKIVPYLVAEIKSLRDRVADLEGE